MAAWQGELVGHAQLRFDWRDGNARLSRVVISPQARGKRLAAPMLRLVLDRGFAWPAIERIELNVHAHNLAAIRTYRSLGFVTEGLRRSSALVGDERWHTVVMGLLRGEWMVWESGVRRE